MLLAEYHKFADVNSPNVEQIVIMRIAKDRPRLAPSRKYTVKEVCAALGISRTTLWRIRKWDIIPFKYNDAMGCLCALGCDVIKYWETIRY